MSFKERERLWFPKKCENWENQTTTILSIGLNSSSAQLAMQTTRMIDCIIIQEEPSFPMGSKEKNVA